MKINPIYVLLIFVIILSNRIVAELIPSKIVPDLSEFDDAGGEAMMGGYVVKLHCPEGVETFEWGKNEFTLAFSIGITNNKVESVERIFAENEPGDWVKRFEESCVESFKEWEFHKYGPRRES